MAEQLRLLQFGLDVDGGDLSCASSESDVAIARDRFVRNGLIAGAGLLLGGSAAAWLAAPGAAAARNRRQDRRIMRFLLQLEYLQAEFYAAAVRRGRLRGELREFAEVVGAQEREHVSLLERRLGRSAGPKPTFDFGDAVESAARFARAARQLEETGVAAYIGQGANLTARTVATVARITSVEARHAAWIADFLGREPAPRAADKAQTSRQVQAAIRRLGFLG
jgi:Ferritin-like domain